MQFVDRRLCATAVLLLFGIANASTITTSPNAVQTTISTRTCEFRTINYITDSLPQQCLKSAWSQANGTASARTAEAASASDGPRTVGLDSSITSARSGEVQDATSSEAVAGESATRSPGVSPTTADAAETSAIEVEEPAELNDDPFLSFEEWRKQTLEKAGQQNANIGGRRSGENRRRDSESFQNDLDSLGEEGEIDLDFGAFNTGGNGKEMSKDSHNGESALSQERQGREVKKRDHRNKDAGKTCKERFSYASFDAGATIVKTHRGAKNPKAVLIENKDSYMLSECSSQNKFLIIELSEDIWIDTLVLANYEFFSSMIKSFRVSLSDKYPVKMEKWKDVGTYEARNSREIQAFLIENPQIWARYLRIEFLTHYGNEYYCPLSLVRVHGARMLENWKETESNNDDEDDESEDAERAGIDGFVPEAVAEPVLEEEKLQAELKEAQVASQTLTEEAQETYTTFTDTSANSTNTNAMVEDEEALTDQMSTPWIPGFDFGAWMNISQGLDVCLPKESPTSQQNPIPTSNVETVTSITGYCSESTSLPSLAVANNTGSTTTSTPPSAEASSSSCITSTENSSRPNHTSSNAIVATPTSNSTIPTSIASSVTTPAKSHNSTSTMKTKASSTVSSPSSLPTQQESFFKAVSRRLQLLEANSTLSLKYIEEQSKALREAFIKVEKKQLQKTTTFLDTINGTLFTELRQIRQQYDEIWQSTVISLESQREESKREIVAISTRLSILADEVVFQKRMSIVQSVLLLLCLGLVIFSRVSTNSPIEYPSKSRFFNFSVESPTDLSFPGSPEYVMPEDDLPDLPPLPHERHGWAGNGHIRPQSEGSILSLDGGDEDLDQYEEADSLPTPISAYCRSDLSLSSPSQHGASTPPHSPSLSGAVEPPIPIRISSYNDNVNDLPVRTNSNTKNNKTQAQTQTGASPVRRKSSKKKKMLQRQRQQASPPIEDIPPTPTNGFFSSPLSSPPVVPTRTHFPSQSQNHNNQAAPAPPTSTGAQNGGGRNRSSGSFSIARKPLPALPDADAG